MIRFVCPSCHRTMTVPDELAGRHGSCSFCRHGVTVPMSSTVPAAGGEPSAAPAVAVAEEVVTAEVAVEPPPPAPNDDEDEGIDLSTYVSPSATKLAAAAPAGPAGETPFLLAWFAFACVGWSALTALYAWNTAAHAAVGYAWLGLMAAGAAWTVIRRRRQRSAFVLAALGIAAVTFIGIAAFAAFGTNRGTPTVPGK
jgi:hypothetical protein